MKAFMTGLVLIGASSAMAMPTVGDYMNFNYTITQGGRTYTGEYSEKLISYDTNTQEYTAELVQTQNGQSKTSQTTIAQNQLLTDAQIADVSTNCAQYNGTVENVMIDKVSFAACKINFQDDKGHGTEWLAQIPFGVVKYYYAYDTGETESLIAKNYSYGQ